MKKDSMKKDGMKKDSLSKDKMKKQFFPSPRYGRRNPLWRLPVQ